MGSRSEHLGVVGDALRGPLVERIWKKPPAGTIYPAAFAGGFSWKE